MFDKKNSKTGKPGALFRADASLKTGTGHAMRCLALAIEWKRQGGRAFLLTAGKLEAVEDRFKKAGIPVFELGTKSGTLAEAGQVFRKSVELDAPWVVVDGYGFNPRYLETLKERGLRVLVIDDFGDRIEYPVDAVLNQNEHAVKSFYAQSAKDAKLFLGTHYCLLRPEFFPWKDKPRKTADLARKILVTLGGTDPGNLSGKILKALQNYDGFHLKIVAGQSNPHAAALRALAKKSKAKIEIIQNASNMPALMHWADLAFSAGGSTCWELAFMGVPNLTGTVVAHQRHVAESIEKSKAGQNLGDYRKLSPRAILRAMMRLAGSKGLRETMSHRGRRLIDGMGASKVTAWMRHEAVKGLHG